MDHQKCSKIRLPVAPITLNPPVGPPDMNHIPLYFHKKDWNGPSLLQPSRSCVLRTPLSRRPVIRSALSLRVSLPVFIGRGALKSLCKWIGLVCWESDLVKCWSFAAGQRL